MRKKIAAWLLFMAALLTLPTGCGRHREGSEWNTNGSSIYIAKDHTVRSSLVYSSDRFNELYNQDELTAFIGQAVADYISEHGETAVGNNTKPPVIVKSCSLEGRTGTVIFEYASAEDFVEFAQATGDDTHTVSSLLVGTVPETVLDMAYLTPSGKKVSYKEACKKSGAGAIAVEGAGIVCTEGKILYVSEGITVLNNFRVKTPEGPSCIIFK